MTASDMNATIDRTITTTDAHFIWLDDLLDFCEKDFWLSIENENDSCWAYFEVVNAVACRRLIPYTKKCSQLNTWSLWNVCRMWTLVNVDFSQFYVPHDSFVTMFRHRFQFYICNTFTSKWWLKEATSWNESNTFSLLKVLEKEKQFNEAFGMGSTQLMIHFIPSVLQQPRPS